MTSATNSMALRTSKSSFTHGANPTALGPAKTSSFHDANPKVLEPVKTTTEKTALKKVVEDEEEKYDDTTELIDLDLGMFASSDTDSIEEARRESDHPALYYTMTLNWENS